MRTPSGPGSSFAYRDRVTHAASSVCAGCRLIVQGRRGPSPLLGVTVARHDGGMAETPSAAAMPITMLIGGAVAHVAPDADLHRLADTLVEAGVGALVIGDGDRAEAIVSERDLVVALSERRDPAGTTAAEISHDTLVWCDADAPVAEVAGQMMEHYVRHVLVEQDGKLVGIVSARDLLGVYAGEDVPEPLDG